MKSFVKFFFITFLMASLICSISAQDTADSQPDGFLYIPGGSFLMGSPERSIRHSC